MHIDMCHESTTCVMNPRHVSVVAPWECPSLNVFLLMVLPPRLLYRSFSKKSCVGNQFHRGLKKDYMTNHLLNILSNKLVI
jgi:hypothetical protein